MSEIRPISDIQRQMALQKQERARKREGIHRTHMGEDSITTSGNVSAVESMVSKLMDMPEVRPEMVELGKQLANSKDFPSDDVMDQLAEALLSPFDDTGDLT